MGIKPFTMGKPKNDDPSNIVLDFTKSMDNIPIMASDDKKKKGRPRSGSAVEPASPLFVNAPHMNTTFVEVAGNENKSDRELSFMESNEPYEKKFQDLL